MQKPHSVSSGRRENGNPVHPAWRLCARREWPRCGGAADKCDEFPSPHGSPQGLPQLSHFRSGIAPFVTPSPSAPMSALGQKRTLRHLRSMSALPPIADIGERGQDVRFVPKADIGPHWITSSARANNVGGIVRPSAFAALRLIMSSSFTARWTGRSPVFSPLRMRPA